MKRLVLSLSILSSGTLLANDKGPENLRVESKDPPLSKKEWHAAKLAHGWINAKSKPFIKEEGIIYYTYGTTMPSVICAPLKVCSIDLEAGEQVKDVLIGDSARWQIKPAVSGSAQGPISHVVVKPFEVGLVTTLMITTDRRTYHLKLVSRKKNFMPRVAFVYPQQVEAEWNMYYASLKTAEEKRLLPETSESIDELFFDYKISGDKPPWRPVRVYNNGVKTIIQMPKAMNQTQAPALLVLGDSGEKQIVNYRLKNDRFIVDLIFKKAVLISGVGRHQRKVTIKLNSKKFFSKPKTEEKGGSDEIASN